MNETIQQQEPQDDEVFPCIINRFSWIYFDDDEPYEGYIAITDGKSIEFCKCWLGIDGELNYIDKQITEFLAWFDANELMIGVNSL